MAKKTTKKDGTTKPRTRKLAPKAAPRSPAVAAPRAAAPTPPDHGEIAILARRIWEERNRPQGQDLDIWCEAERRLTTGQ